MYRWSRCSIGSGLSSEVGLKGCGYLAVLNLANDAAGRVFPGEILFGQPHGRKLLQTLLHRGIVNGGGMELLCDPGIKADGFHFFDLIRPGAKGKPVQCMQDEFITLNLP